MLPPARGDPGGGCGEIRKGSQTGYGPVREGGAWSRYPTWKGPSELLVEPRPEGNQKIHWDSFCSHLEQANSCLLSQCHLSLFLHRTRRCPGPGRRLGLAEEPRRQLISPAEQGSPTMICELESWERVPGSCRGRGKMAKKGFVDTQTVWLGEAPGDFLPGHFICVLPPRPRGWKSLCGQGLSQDPGFRGTAAALPTPTCTVSALLMASFLKKYHFYYC